MKKYHFIGIGGVSMSALALIVKHRGNIVTGSDKAKSAYTNKLEENGISVSFNHRKRNVIGADIVVFNSAIKDDNVELVQAKELGITTISRAELLDYISKDYDCTIAVSGAHGKTTTTAMITEVFQTAKFFPTAHLGGTMKSVDSNFILGKNNFFITEACEYKNNFLKLNANLGVILNVEAEHLDFFKNFGNVISSFKKFASNCQTVVISDKVEFCPNNSIMFGNCGFRATKIRPLKFGKYSFVCYHNNKKLFKIKMNVVGKYNIENALACIATCKHFGIKNKIIKSALENFQGVKRRFEIKKQKPFIVHDYAHHPSEISSVITATKQFVMGRLFVVFQPHTYSRTKALMTQFENCFEGADEVIIQKTYSAREKPIKSGSAKQLFYNLKGKYENVEYFETFECSSTYLKQKIKNKDTVLILGAGNIEDYADYLI